MVNDRIVIWLMTSHRFRRTLLPDQGALGLRRGRRIGRAGLNRRFSGV